MLKIKLVDLASETPIAIDENDRGNWEVKPYDGDTGAVHIVGFGGENVITIHLMPMQDGTCSVVVTHAMCDNPIEVAQGRSPRRAAHEDYYAPAEALINQLIAQACDYPEEL